MQSLPDMIVFTVVFQLQLNEIRSQLVVLESEKSELDERMKMFESDINVKEVT